MAWGCRVVIPGVDPAKELAKIETDPPYAELKPAEQEQVQVAKQLVVDLLARSNLGNGAFRINIGGNRPTEVFELDRGYLSVSVAQSPDILPKPEE